MNRLGALGWNFSLRLPLAGGIRQRNRLATYDSFPSSSLGTLGARHLPRSPAPAWERSDSPQTRLSLFQAPFGGLRASSERSQAGAWERGARRRVPSGSSTAATPRHACGTAIGVGHSRTAATARTSSRSRVVTCWSAVTQMRQASRIFRRIGIETLANSTSD